MSIVRRGEHPEWLLGGACFVERRSRVLCRQVMHGSEIQAKYGSNAWRNMYVDLPRKILRTPENTTHPGNMEILRGAIATFFPNGCEPSTFQSTHPC